MAGKRDCRMDAATEACLNLGPGTKCAFCDESGNVYAVGDKWICIEHLIQTVSLAANDVFSDCVSYTKSFENVLLW